MDLLVGHSLGQYQVRQLIGQGGMANVYKAYQPSLDRYVAIKVISTHVDNTRDPSFAQRFTAEARLIAKLTHPNIVPIHDYGEEQGWAFIVMEYIAGGTLRDRMVQADQRRSLVDLAPALELLAQAALGLDCAHQHGVIHRDVKPANMLLRTDDHLLLSDFGIAAILEANKAFTRSGGNAGTPQYMAPEQGMPNGVIDARTDIYALGVVLFQAVTGRLPFDAPEPMGIVVQHAHEPVPRPGLLVPGLPQRVEQIILRAMEKQPGRRFQHAREMADQLKTAASEVRRSQRASTPTTRMNGHYDGYLGQAGQLPPRGVPGQPGTCFRCGAANNPLNRYCTTCGYDLSGKRAEVDRFRLPNGRPLRCRVTLRNGTQAGFSYVLHQDVTSLGRTAGNDLIIQDPTISRHHARLFFHNGQWSVEDLNSSNGTYVNGARVTRPMPLQHGDELRLGDDFMGFELLG